MALFENLGRTMAPADRLKLACETCGHRAEWDRRTAFRRLGPDAAPFDIRRKLRCGACGDGEHVRVWI
jgi:hypothetical protein